MPYGKIEDGLPRWHEKQRINEYFKIDDIISNELVDFVPLTRIGKDVSFEEIYNMGWSCIYFANGAWKDRSFPIKKLKILIIFITKILLFIGSTIIMSHLIMVLKWILKMMQLLLEVD